MGHFKRTDGAESPQPLARWLQRSYMRAAIIPLVSIELLFLLIYWLSGTISYRSNVEAVASISRTYVSDIATREGSTVDAQLDGVALMTETFARASARALTTPHNPPASEKARYGRGSGGTFVTLRGDPAEDAAAFYSGAVPVGPEEIDKVWRSTALDPGMRDIVASSPLVSQVYVNTSDSYNRIFPYIDVTRQYAPGMRIPDYNFYYEADAKHNPRRKAVWTDAYVDPAGGGWMVSSIAPVYDRDRLLAVVGIDVTVDSIIRQVLNIRLPWNGYAMLIGRDGTILALPEPAERDLGLRELRRHAYADAIRSDTFKPDTFNINHRPELAPLARQLGRGRRETALLHLSGRNLIVASAPLPDTGWTLAVLVPQSEVLAEADALRDRFELTGIVMAAVLLLFYVGFFALLVRRARAMSRRVGSPLQAIEAIMARIGAGQYQQQPLHSGIAELDHVSDRLVDMGRTLGDAHERILKQDQEIRRALASEQETTRGQRRLISVISHELRTPLTIIDSAGQILRRRAGWLDEAAICERADLLREAAARMGGIVGSAVDFASFDPQSTGPQPQRLVLSDILSFATATQPQAAGRIQLSVSEPERVLEGDAAMLTKALSSVLDNALKYGGDGSIEVSAVCTDDTCAITVRDRGGGVADDELPLLADLFFRGRDSTAVPGAGVGLYLARQWLTLHGGSLSLAAAAGGGLEVTLSLPIRWAGADKGAKAASPAGPNCLPEAAE